MIEPSNRAELINKIRQIFVEYGITRRQINAGLIGMVIGAILTFPILWASGQVPWIFSFLTIPAMVLFYFMALFTRVDFLSNATDLWATGALWTIAFSLVTGVYAFAIRTYIDQEKKPRID